MFNLINLVIWEKLDFLGLESTRIGDFVQIGFKWWNWLVGLIILITMNYFLSCVMINWSIWYKLNKWFFKIFCHFPPFFLQGFSPLRPVRHFYPSFCIYLHVSSIKSCDLGKISNLRILGVFDDSTCFSWNWSIGFYSKTLYNCSWWFNLINLLFCEKLKFLGLEYTRIGDFVQIGFNWWNWLIGLINLIIMNCFLPCVMIN